VLTLATMFLVGQSDSVERCEADENAAHPHPERSDGRPHLVSPHCVWYYLSENDKPILSGATVALVLVTGFLWLATRQLALDARDTSTQTLEQMREAEQRELRAYVGCEGYGALPAESFGDPVVWLVKMENYGQTPATDVTFTITAKVLPAELPQDYVFVDDIPPGAVPKTVLHPGAITIGQSDPDYAPLSPDAIRDLDRGKNPQGQPVRLYVYGTVEYRDVFGKRHWTNYAYRYRSEIPEPIKKKGTGEELAFAEHCPLHNDIGTYPDTDEDASRMTGA